MGFLGKCIRNEFLAKKALLADKFFSEEGNENATYADFLKYYENFVVNIEQAKRNQTRYIRATFSAFVTMYIEHEEVSTNLEFEINVPDYIYKNNDTTELLEYIKSSDEFISRCNPRIYSVGEIIEVGRFL